MDWFKRYGIPGTYFYGISILWFAALYNSKFDEVLNSDNLKIMIGIAVVSFLPIGYFISVLGQLIYHWIPRMGVDTKARIIAGVTTQCPSNLEWKQEIVTISQIITRIANKNKNTKTEVDVMRFILEWLNRRMDMIVINTLLFLANVLAPLSVLLFLRILKLDYQFNKEWFLVAFSIFLIVFVVSWSGWYSLREQLARIEAKVLFQNLLKQDSNIPSTNEASFDGKCGVG